ncbi:MAG: SDR family oxidoreductase [Myxococcota bacterium]|nr:SDR family oxidoreductase [Myxococcota bacterium]
MRVLLTGVTGFLGKVVLSELFRHCDSIPIDSIHVLIRRSGNKSALERYASIVRRSPCFEGKGDAYWNRVHVVEGELAQPYMGLSEESYGLLANTITHVIHCAASVEFDLPLAKALLANVDTSRELLAFARKSLRMKRAVFVSTAYVTPARQVGNRPIKERLARLPRKAAAVLSDIQNGTVSEADVLAQTGHPNTYTFTKCLNEHLCEENRGALDLRWVRPSIISASLQYPTPGWIDSKAAFAGFVAMAGAGQLRVLKGNPQTRLDIVPVDKVALDIIATLLEERRDIVTPFIRHSVAGLSNSPTIARCASVVSEYFRRNRVFGRGGVKRIEHGVGRFKFWDAVLHGGPSVLLTNVGKLIGGPHMARRSKLVRARQKYLAEQFHYFMTHTFDFVSHCEPLSAHFHRADYIRLVCEGVYRFIFRMDSSQVTIAGKKSLPGVPDFFWALLAEKGDLTVRSFGFVLKKLSRYCFDNVTYDHESFLRAMSQVRQNERVLIIPTHRSYADFLLCSYLFFNNPEIGVALPNIAADESFAGLPFLGGLFRGSKAFFLKRGLGQVEPALVERIRKLTGDGEAIEFFIEGSRSRGREYQTPKEGLLRCLKDTGFDFAILPVAISYDRVPEEKALFEEMQGLPKKGMQLSGLLRWISQVLQGQVELGRIHIRCGAKLSMGGSSEVSEVAEKIMHTLQISMAVSSFHLDAFARAENLRLAERDALSAILEEKGVSLVESPLAAHNEMLGASELSLRNQWMFYLYPEIKALFESDEMVQHFLRSSSYGDFGDIPSLEKERLLRFGEILIRPVRFNYGLVANQLRNIGMDGKLETMGAPVMNDGVFKPYWDAGVDYFIENEVLSGKRKDGLKWGSQAESFLAGDFTGISIGSGKGLRMCYE